MSGVSREMKVRKQDLPGAQHVDFARLRLLHLYDHGRASENLLSRGGDASAGCGVGVIRVTNSNACACLDDDAVAMMDELAHRPGRQTDPVFLHLHLPRDADLHCFLLNRAGCDLRDAASQLLSAGNPPSVCASTPQNRAVEGDHQVE